MTELASGDLSRQRNVMQSMFTKYRASVKQRLAAAPNFSAINDDGVALVFASVVAYESKPPVQPLAQIPACFGQPGCGSAVLMAHIADTVNVNNGIICGQSQPFAVQLFYAIKADSQIQITLIGTGRDAPWDNHATIMATGTGVPLFPDPTTSIVGAGSLFDLLARRPIQYVEFSRRSDALDAPGGFRDRIKNTLTAGAYDYRSLIYAAPVTGPPPSSTNQVPYFNTQGNFQNRTEDLIAETTWANVGGQQTFWFRTVDGRAWRINGSGILSKVSDGVASLVPVGTDMYLLTQSGALNRYSATGPAVIQTAIAQIAAGPSNDSVYLMNSAGATSRIDSARVTAAVNAGGTRNLVGTGDAVYLHTTSGPLWQIKSTGWYLVGNSIDSIAPGYPSRNDVGPVNRSCTSTAACPGEIYMRSSHGSLYGDLYWRGPGSAWTLMQSSVAQYLVWPVRRVSVNILTGTGIVWRWESPVTRGTFNPPTTLRNLLSPTDLAPLQDGKWNPQIPPSGSVGTIRWQPGFWGTKFEALAGGLVASLTAGTY